MQMTWLLNIITTYQYLDMSLAVPIYQNWQGRYGKTNVLE